MPVDSQVKQLNSFEIVVDSLKQNPQPHPMQAMIAGAIARLTHKLVKTKQIGNTLFYVIKGDKNYSYFSSYNADVAERFIENAGEMLVYCKNKLKIKHLVLDADTPEEIKIFSLLIKNSPIKNMRYESGETKNGKTQFVLTLGG